MTGIIPIPARVPVQSDGPYWLAPSHPARKAMRTHEPGIIARDEYLVAYSAYICKFGDDQTAERIIERREFSYFELVDLLGHEPETFEPLKGGEQQ